MSYPVNTIRHIAAESLQLLDMERLAQPDMAYHSGTVAITWQAQLGRALAKAREIAGLSQAAVALLIRENNPARQRKDGHVKGKPTQTVSRLENGEGVNTNYIDAYLTAVKATLTLTIVATDATGQRVPVMNHLQDQSPRADVGDAKQNSHEEEGDLLHLPAGFPDITLFHGMIAIWHRLRTAPARERFLDAAGAYAQNVADNGEASTGALGNG